jgi:hypothetical protein
MKPRIFRLDGLWCCWTIHPDRAECPLASGKGQTPFAAYYSWSIDADRAGVLLTQGFA